MKRSSMYNEGSERARIRGILEKRREAALLLQNALKDRQQIEDLYFSRLGDPDWGPETAKSLYQADLRCWQGNLDWANCMLAMPEPTFKGGDLAD